jgi:redox-sensitive bicupin YhaK (pirin superfamily)
MQERIHLPKDKQQLMPLFNGAFVENKPIPFPELGRSKAYSNLFYWAHLIAHETSEFPLHPHEGFEIMTFVFEGSVEHYDTATKVWTPLSAGGVQVIQAGSGVQHAERIVEGTRMFQIWFDPDFSKSMPKNAAYQDYAPQRFVQSASDGMSEVVYVGDHAPIYSETPGIEIRKIRFEEGMHTFDLDRDATYSYYLLEGEMSINGVLLNKDDFLAESGLLSGVYEVNQAAELFVITTPTQVKYPLFKERYF